VAAVAVEEAAVVAEAVAGLLVVLEALKVAKKSSLSHIVMLESSLPVAKKTL
jgi:hypothetical protein